MNHLLKASSAIIWLGMCANGIAQETPVTIPIYGEGCTEQTVPRAAAVDKNGGITAILGIKGSCSIEFNGSGDVYLLGLQDYSKVTVTSKAGSGSLIWIPLNTGVTCFVPVILKRSGAGTEREGTKDELKQARCK